MTAGAGCHQRVGSGDGADEAVGVPGSSVTGEGLLGPSATGPLPEPVPVPPVPPGDCDGATELMLGLGAGELDVGGFTEVEGTGSTTPGPGFVADLDGVGPGSADAPGPAGPVDLP